MYIQIESRQVKLTGPPLMLSARNPSVIGWSKSPALPGGAPYPAAGRVPPAAPPAGRPGGAENIGTDGVGAGGV